MRSMTRMAVSGCMALAAFGAVAVLDVGSPTAEAAPSVSPFAGTFVSNSWPAPINISDAGRITSSYSIPSEYKGSFKGSISGSVTADGNYSFTVSQTNVYYGDLRHGRVPKEGWIWFTETYEATGNMAPDTDGNIVGTGVTGGSFIWYRR